MGRNRSRAYAWIDSLPGNQALSFDWPRAVLASTISNLRERKVGNVKRDTLSTPSEQPHGPLSDLERSEFYLREGERLAHYGKLVAPGRPAALDRSMSPKE